MAFGDNLPALGAISLVEAYLLQRTVFADETFRTVCLWALGSNLAILFLYSAIVWPFFLNPLRHLPTVPVSLAKSWGYSVLSSIFRVS